MRHLCPDFQDAPDFKEDINKFHKLEYPEKDLTLCIDPLDGSKGFSEGHTHHLTCIIGVAYRNRPRLGIIHKPNSSFPQLNSERTYIGIPEAGLFTIDYSDNSFGELISSNPTY